MLSGVVLALLVSVMVLGAALAAPDGQPEAHGLDGKTFGSVVSGTAQSSPSAIADFLSNK